MYFTDLRRAAVLGIAGLLLLLAGGSLAPGTDPAAAQRAISPEEEAWIQGLQLKFMGYVRCMKAVIPHMLKQGKGRIVNIVGNDGVKPIGIELSPSAANAADLAVTVALAEQYGKNNICINAINPGGTLTGRVRQGLEAEAKMTGLPEDELLTYVSRWGSHTKCFDEDE